jgi:hypothetical protein
MIKEETNEEDDEDKEDYSENESDYEEVKVQTVNDNTESNGA